MPSDDDSGSNKPPKTPPKDAPPVEGPVEPEEDSADDPVPENLAGTETDEELEKEDAAEVAQAIDPPPPERMYRKGRLSDRTIEPRLRRRFCRKVKDEDALDTMIQETFLRACSAPVFPREHEPMFTYIYKPASASRKQMMRELDRRRQRERPLKDVDKEKWTESPDGGELSDLDADRYELLATVAKNDATARRALEGMRDEVAHAMSPEEVALEQGVSHPAYRKRKSRVREAVLALASTKGLVALAVIGGAIYAMTLPDWGGRKHDPIEHTLPEREAPQKAPPADMRAIAAQEKADGLKACAAQDWDRCRVKLSMAQLDDPTLENDPEVARAAVEARDRRPTPIDSQDRQPPNAPKGPSDKGAGDKGPGDKGAGH